MAEVNDLQELIDDQVVPQSINLPAPPPFYKAFTAENLSALQSVKTQLDSPGVAAAQSQPQHALAPDQVPDNLRLLVPPNPPDTEEYGSFGQTHQLSGFQLPPLRDYGVEQVFPPLDQSRDAVPSQLAPQFIHIIRSVLANFLEVTNILSMDPEKAPDKLEDLRVLLLNAHRVLNEYRPHHARETLIHLMQQRVDGLQKQIRDVTDMEAQVDDVLASLGIVDDEHSTQTADGMSRIERAEQQKEADRAQHMWTALDNIELG